MTREEMKELANTGQYRRILLTKEIYSDRYTPVATFPPIRGRRYENSKRGVYGGALGYLDFTGNMDVCIAIRLVYKKNGEICIRSGAGIVADSNPTKEYEECNTTCTSW